MNIHQHVEIVREYLKRVGRGEYRAAVELVQPDVRILVPSELPYGGTWTGRDQLVQLLSEVDHAWSGWVAMTDPPPMAGVGNRVFRELEFHGTLVRTGRQVGMFLAEVFEFRDGRISEIRHYFADPVSLLDPDDQGKDGT